MITKFLWPQSLCTQFRVVELVLRSEQPSSRKILLVNISPVHWLVLCHTIQYLLGLAGVGGRVYLNWHLHWQPVIYDVFVVGSCSSGLVLGSSWSVLQWLGRLAWHMVQLRHWVPVVGRLAEWRICGLSVPFGGVASRAVLHYVARLSTLHALSPTSLFFS